MVHNLDQSCDFCLYVFLLQDELLIFNIRDRTLAHLAL